MTRHSRPSGLCTPRPPRFSSGSHLSRDRASRPTAPEISRLSPSPGEPLPVIRQRWRASGQPLPAVRRSWLAFGQAWPNAGNASRPSATLGRRLAGLCGNPASLCRPPADPRRLSATLLRRPAALPGVRPALADDRLPLADVPGSCLDPSGCLGGRERCRITSPDDIEASFMALRAKREAIDRLPKPIGDSP